jgi:glycosyltransferase involved in cell wall biosynthesis
MLSTKASLIPHWITNNSFPSPKPTNDPKMLLFVGRNEKNKGIDHLYTLPKHKYNVHCVTNKKLERNDFTYHINIENNELSSLYNKASLVIVPSKYEAFSLVALEALSHETPVLASDRVRIADHIHGCSGFIVFNYDDYSDFIDKIESAQNLYVDSSKIKNIFSAEKALERYTKIYREVMN